MALLTREAILAADDCSASETIPVPEWGGEVVVGVITGDERDRFDLYRERQLKRGGNTEGVRSLLVALACRGEDKKPLFKPEDVAELGRKSSRALERVFDAALRVNGIGEAANEDAVKNC